MAGAELRVGVIGCGRWAGWAHLPGWTRDERCQVVAVCDRDEGLVLAAADRFGVADAFTDHRRVIERDDVDVIDVVTGDEEHFTLTMAALEAGKHVLCEKPVAHDYRDTLRARDLAASKGLGTKVGFTFRYSPAVRYMKELVKNGELGDLYYITSQRVNLGKVRQDENALWSFAPHDLSVILHLLEDEPMDVAARGSAFLQGGVEDVVFLHLRFPGGRMAHVHVSWLDPHKLRQFTLVGSRKMVVFDDMEASEKIRVYDKGVDRGNQFVSYSDALTVRSGDIVLPRISLQEPLRIECQHFVDCIRERRTPLTDGEGGLAVVRVLAAAQASLEAGGAPISVRPQTAETR